MYGTFCFVLFSTVKKSCTQLVRSAESIAKQRICEHNLSKYTQIIAMVLVIPLEMRQKVRIFNGEKKRNSFIQKTGFKTYASNDKP